MTGALDHVENYPGKYTIPGLHAGYLPRGPPLPDPKNPNVLRFTAHKKNILHGAVLNYADTEVFRFHSKGRRQLEMYDAGNNLVASYDHGTVVYLGGLPTKGKKFVQHGAPGKTGAVFIYDETEYEVIQELFYAIVRKIPHCERTAVVYNYTGKLAVELIEEGIGNTDLQTKLVFVTALEEIGWTKRGVGRAMRRWAPEKNQ